jgi:hypothetical protein
MSRCFLVELLGILHGIAVLVDERERGDGSAELLVKLPKVAVVTPMLHAACDAGKRPS